MGITQGSDSVLNLLLGPTDKLSSRDCTSTCVRRRSSWYYSIAAKGLVLMPTLRHTQAGKTRSVGGELRASFDVLFGIFDGHNGDFCRKAFC
jgi:hypothetical protein